MTAVIVAVVCFLGGGLAEFIWSWWWKPRRLGARVLAAEPAIHHIIEHIDSGQLTHTDLYRRVATELAGVDTTAATIRMAAVMLEQARRHGTPVTELLEAFPDWRKLQCTSCGRRADRCRCGNARISALRDGAGGA
ncbi:hypothetical protein [Nocardia wallacei]|uniref:Uncharacterized protein n=1 Tax=Nocardia wallacei TaxID=480035 RepID=A0A7G1KWG3_9NOCA|nr:hypothetical protein [Nocardia wallacei]BCK58359.1 hypothetical protein NWFMUON74_61310 [Nocardia wallacei]